MGTRLVTDAARLSYRGGQRDRIGGALLKEQLSGNYKMQVIYDGTTGKQGLPDALEPFEAWVDGSGLYRQGLNFGPTFQNIGTCSCTIYGAHAPREYAYNTAAAQVSFMTGKWEQLATLATGESHFVQNVIFSLFRFVFTVNGSDSGCVVALSN